MKHYTDITVLVDRSGSMQTIKTAMEGAFKTFIRQHSKTPSTRLTLINFDDINDQEVAYSDMPIREAASLNLKPRGNTPLLDAFCKTIDGTGRRLSALPEQDRPDQVLMVVITDGQENCSKEFRRDDVRARVKDQTNNFNWQFVYLGANQDVFKEAFSFGIPQTHAAFYKSTPGSTQSAWTSMTANTVSYANQGGGLRGQSVSLDFSDEQRENMVTANPTPKVP